MQVAGLGDPVGGVGERERGGRARDAAEPELPCQQVGAEEAQRPREQEQQVVVDERGHGPRPEPRDRPVAQQRVGERQAQGLGIEGVGVPQVQRVVEHRVTHPGDLPGRPHGVPEVGGDVARQMQDQWPARQHRERHAGERGEQQLPPTELRRRRPPGPAGAAPGGSVGRQRAVAEIGRRGGDLVAPRSGTWGAGHAGAERGLVFSRADRRSIRNTPATVKHLPGESAR